MSAKNEHERPFELGSQQTKAVESIREWYKAKRRSKFYLLAGYAGTGKTSLIRFVMQSLELRPHQVALATFTGKASVVLGSAVGWKARTIHSLIYRKNTTPRGRTKKIANAQNKMWVLDRSALAGKKLVVIDEVSMVDKQMFNDLLSFNIPCLMLGDPFQLPPVSGVDIFDEHEPDMFLDQIHRQALENPIIRLSQDLREGKDLPRFGVFGDANSGSVIIKSQQSISDEEWTGADLVLAARNKTRVHRNQWFRGVYGYASDLPEKGERVVCLRNQRDLGLNNGMLGTVVEGGSYHDDTDYYEMSVRMDGADDQDEDIKVEVAEVRAISAESYKPIMTDRYDPALSAFTYGYCLTVHKAQGSQAEKGVIIREFIPNIDALRHTYTALTRFRKHVIVTN